MGLKSRESILFTRSSAILDESELKRETEEKQKGCKGRGGMEEKTAYPVACSLRKVAVGLVLERKSRESIVFTCIYSIRHHIGCALK